MARRWRLGLAALACLPLAAVVAFLVADVGDAGSSIVGQVRDGEGRPLAGAQVSLEAHVRKGGDEFGRFGSQVSDSTGCFHLGALHARGSIRVVVTREGYRALVVPGPGGSSVAHAVLRPSSDARPSEGVLLRRDPRAPAGERVSCAPAPPRATR